MDEEHVEPEKIKIECPICGGTHLYPVTVERSTIVLRLSPSDDIRERRRSFVRLFMCPIQGSQFQAKLTFTETVFDPIESVTVGESSTT